MLYLRYTIKQGDENVAKVITFGNQKGGVGKTTTAGMSAWILSQKYKVLAVDFDSQGNLTQLLTQQNIYDFTGQTVLQAVKERNARKFIHVITENLHILPAEDELVTLSRWLYEARGGANPGHVLDEALATVRDVYDYILIDQPPNLGDHTVNALGASDYVVVVMQAEQFCLNALERYFSVIKSVQLKINPIIRVAGVLPAISDARALSDQMIVERARKDYGNVVFRTEVRRRSRVKEYPIIGIQSGTKADREAHKTYAAFIEELIERVK
jgi:chromosome partitioning protein